MRGEEGADDRPNKGEGRGGRYDGHNNKKDDNKKIYFKYISSV